jgi:ribosomal protein L31
MARIWDLTITIPFSGCYVYGGSLNPAGYGQISLPTGMTKSRQAGVHRVAYEALVGPIPSGMHIDHKCRVRSCWRPDHLRVVICANGHPFDGLDPKTGQRLCSICKREASRKWARKFQAARRRQRRALALTGEIEAVHSKGAEPMGGEGQ